MSKTSVKTTVEWNQTDWRRLERRVFKLQKRIFRASSRGDLQAVRRLQKLEPEWESRFEPNSYGFRPGRSCHDAIEAIFSAIKHKAKYVLDADIAKCFDRINHGELLRKLNTFPTLRRQIKSWLKSGVMDGGQLFATSEGTPQGGVISPLLANIALHGMEERIKQVGQKDATLIKREHG